MDALTSILKRASVRQYSDKIVPKEDIEKLIKAGMSAPSAYGRRPWFFVVIDNKEILLKIASNSPYSSMADQASVAILVCGDLNIENNEIFLLEDCSAAIENIIIAATSLNLGTVWTTIYPFKEMVSLFSNALNLPENLLPISLLPIGYPLEEPNLRENFEEDKLHYNRF